MKRHLPLPFKPHISHHKPKFCRVIEFRFWFGRLLHLFFRRPHLPTNEPNDPFLHWGRQSQSHRPSIICRRRRRSLGGDGSQSAGVVQGGAPAWIELGWDDFDLHDVPPSCPAAHAQPLLPISQQKQAEGGWSWSSQALSEPNPAMYPSGCPSL